MASRASPDKHQPDAEKTKWPEVKTENTNSEIKVQIQLFLCVFHCCGNIANNIIWHRYVDDIINYMFTIVPKNNGNNITEPSTVLF